MKETQEILKQMGFENTGTNVWRTDWFGVLILNNGATPHDLAQFIYKRGMSQSESNSTS